MSAESKPQSHKNLDFRPHEKVFASPSDWRDQFIYHLLVDRFNDGKERPPYTAGLVRHRDDSQGDKWQGGKLKGITERLDYIRGLGCTCIWLSPIFKNRKNQNTYHGYGIQNYLDIDPNFGSAEELLEMVKAAHEKGMYVLLDIVINHTGDNWSYPGGYPYHYFQGQRFHFGYWRDAEEGEIPEPSKTNIHWPHDAVWPEEFQDGEWYRRQGEIQNWDAFPETRDGDFGSLKELDTSNPAVLGALIDAYKYWIAMADIDGYRLDAVKHLEDSSTAIFCNAVREYAQSIGKKNFFLFGEIVGSDDFINQYIGRNTPLPDGERFPSLDAALDFPLWGVLEHVIKGFRNPAELRNRYDRFRDKYTDHGQAGQYFVTFVDNHDQIGRKPKGRFLYNDEEHQDQAVLAVGYLLTSLGIPCIYYGTEQGFDGGVENGEQDKYIRECMFGGLWGAFQTTEHHFFNPEHDIYKGISRVASTREREPALRYGRQYFREISGDGINFGHPIDGKCTLAYSRILDDTEILVAMNLDSSRRSDYITLDSKLTPAGEMLEDLISSDKSQENRFEVESICNAEGIACRHATKLPLESHEMAILKLAS